MKHIFSHNSINVLDIDKSVDFYDKALSLKKIRQVEPPDGSFKLIFLGDGVSSHELELTWLKDRKTPYDLGDKEFHFAFTTDDIKASHALHEKMGCICFENEEMGLYFIEDPDGYWIEIIPDK